MTPRSAGSSGGLSTNVRLAAPQGLSSAWSTYRMVKGVPAKISSGNFLDRWTERIFFLASQWETTTRPTFILKMMKRKLFPVTTAASGIQIKKNRQIHPNAVSLIEGRLCGVNALSVCEAAIDHSPRNSIGHFPGSLGSARFCESGRLPTPASAQSRRTGLLL